MEISAEYQPWKLAGDNDVRPLYKYLNVVRMTEDAGLMFGTDGFGMGVVPVFNLAPDEEGLVLAKSIKEAFAKVGRSYSVYMSIRRQETWHYVGVAGYNLPRYEPGFEPDKHTFPDFALLPNRYPRLGEVQLNPKVAINAYLLKKYSEAVGLNYKRMQFPVMVLDKGNHWIWCQDYNKKDGTLQAPYFILKAVNMRTYNNSMPNYVLPDDEIQEPTE